MKHIKKFNEDVENKKLTFEESQDWIKSNYTEEKIAEMFDEEVSSGNWTDAEQMEEEGYDSEYDYYIDYGRGEAESAVIDEIITDLKSKSELDFDELYLYEFIQNMMGWSI